jgi:GNAT superfamily N-acetyltransferase
MDPAPGRAPGLDWFRDLYRCVGEEWLWFSRLQMTDADLAAIIQSPLVGVYALVQEGRDEGLLELDFREAGQCELAFFGVTAKLIGSGAGRWLMNRALERA